MPFRPPIKQHVRRASRKQRGTPGAGTLVTSETCPESRRQNILAKSKTYKCKAPGCDNRFERTYTTTQQVCDYKCAIAWAKDKESQKNRKELREFNRRDLRWQHKQTQPVFNRMRVLEELKWFFDRGLEPECISCGKTNMDWCCGHFKTRGSQPELRYAKHNTFLQCNRYCNMALSGNIEGNKNTRGYKAGIIERFGEKEGQFIIDDCGTDADAAWTWQQIEGMRKEFNAKIKQLTEEAGR